MNTKEAKEVLETVLNTANYDYEEIDLRLCFAVDSYDVRRAIKVLLEEAK